MKRDELLIIYGKNVPGMTRRLLEEADLAGLIPSKEARIGIKPNLVSPMPAEEGATTHVEVVEALIGYLKENGFANLVMLESSWVGDRTSDSMQICGYNRLSERTGVPFLDLQKDTSREVDCVGLTLKVCQQALALDFLINVPVLKGHCQTAITCALKNMKGLLPASEKRHFHRMGLHDPIAHLSAGVHQDFILVDSICGDLTFEDGGNPVQQDRLMAARDPVLCDAYGCRVLGLETEEVPYIKKAAELGVGSDCLRDEQIRILEETSAGDYVTAEADRLGRMESGYSRICRLSEAACQVDACSACYAALMPALDRLDREGRLKGFDQRICIGQGYRGKTGELGIGNCTAGFTHSLPGCPPREDEVYEFLKLQLG
ncbi:MAG: DUF362 domain-containing protein [Lachnospiraceae bacterium]|nr:DUF362 domain-containing protein [Lachnospiraceae bacterium]